LACTAGYRDCSAPTNLLGQAGVSLCSLWMPLSGEGQSDALEWVAGEILPRL
jgi:hypothetical protein